MKVVVPTKKLYIWNAVGIADDCVGCTDPMPHTVIRTTSAFKIFSV